MSSYCKRMLINATQPDVLRVAIIQSKTSRLLDLDIEYSGLEQKKANIYKGCITSIEPSLGAVFVDYGSERHGFLPLKEISREYFLKEVDSLENIDIHQILKERQELVVQVEKEERGTKGAALTTFISLAGSYLVLMPNNPRGGGISRRIEGDERDQLKETISKLPVPEGMSIIIRTAGVEKSLEELSWDLDVLLRYWEAIKQAAIAKPGPYLIHQESDVIIRAIRDYLRQDIEEVIIDEPAAYERARNYIGQIRPDFVSRFRLYSEQTPLFSRFQIEQQIEEAFQREVRLPSGGSIVIDVTEALVSIDINSAKATKGGSIEETALNTNLEAAEEIARQLRIRDIGGLIVIDFIDMTLTKNQRRVENCLRDALHLDRARIQIRRISSFGLLEMSRQRLRSSLSKSTQITCPRCAGHGTIRSVESMGLSIIHLIQEHTSRSHTDTNSVLQVQLPIDISTYLLNEKRDAIHNIEHYSKKQIVIIPNPYLISPQYQIKEVKNTQIRTIPSYQLAKTFKSEISPQKATSTKKIEPIINDYLTASAPHPPRKSTGGIIRRLWDLMFGPGEPSSKAHKLIKPAITSSLGKAISSKQQSQQKKTYSSPKRSVEKVNLKSTTRRGSRGGNKRRLNNTNRARASKPKIPEDKKINEVPKNNLEDALPKTAAINPITVKPKSANKTTTAKRRESFSGNFSLQKVKPVEGAVNNQSQTATTEGILSPPKQPQSVKKPVTHHSINTMSKPKLEQVVIKSSKEEKDRGEE